MCRLKLLFKFQSSNHIITLLQSTVCNLLGSAS